MMLSERIARSIKKDLRDLIPEDVQLLGAFFSIKIVPVLFDGNKLRTRQSDEKSPSNCWYITGGNNTWTYTDISVSIVLSSSSDFFRYLYRDVDGIISQVCFKGQAE